MARTGLMTAIVFVATRWLPVPAPSGSGYIHTGDAAIFLAAFLFGPGVAAFAAGVGSALSDWTGGYTIYVPATLLIKSVMGGLAGWMILRPAFRARPVAGMAFAALLAGTWMILGYFLYDRLLTGSWAAPLADLPGNLLQASFGGVIGGLLARRLSRLADQAADRSI